MKPSLGIEEIRPHLADVLGIDPEDVTEDARFFIELGGESIDWIDFTFVVKKTFDLPLDEFNKRVRTTETGELTKESIRFVHSFLPTFDPAGLTSSNLKPRMDELLDVAAILRLIGILEAEREGTATPR